MNSSAQEHVDTADSLFGSSGEGGDFFASLGPSTPKDPTHSSGFSSTSAPTDAPAAAADLFGDSTSSQDPFSIGTDTTSSEQHNSGSWPGLQQDGGSYEEQGWYDDDGVFHSYEDTPALITSPSTGHSATVTATPTTTSSYEPIKPAYAPPASTYAPQQAYVPQQNYAPPVPPQQQNYAPQQQSYAPPQQTYAPTQSPYTPARAPLPPSKPPVATAFPASVKQPSTPQSPVRYGVNGTPVQSVPSGSTHDPYAPPPSHARNLSISGRTYIPPRSPQTSVPARPAMAGIVPPVAPPKAPDVSAYRSASYNAYDPPIPDASSRYARAKPAAPVHDPYAPTANSYLPPPKAKPTPPVRTPALPPGPPPPGPPRTSASPAPPPPRAPTLPPGPPPGPPRSSTSPAPPPPGPPRRAPVPAGHSPATSLSQGPPSRATSPAVPPPKPLSPPAKPYAFPPRATSPTAPPVRALSPSQVPISQSLHARSETTSSTSSYAPIPASIPQVPTAAPSSEQEFGTGDEDTSAQWDPEDPEGGGEAQGFAEDDHPTPHAANSMETVRDVPIANGQPAALTTSPPTMLNVIGKERSASLPATQAPYDPYNPATTNHAHRSSAPQVPTNHYAPPPKPTGPQRSFNVPPPVPAIPNPYAPPPPITDPYAVSNNMTRPRQKSEASDYGPPSAQEVSYGAPKDYALPGPTVQAYAPSPSLLGTNDPLGRASKRVPVISFGFGGKFVACFHDANQGKDLGFDVSLSSRPSSVVKLQTLHKVIPDSALDSSAAVFPGPLFADAPSTAAAMGLPGTTNAAKAKKTLVLKYLEERAAEIEAGLGYVTGDNPPERSKAEGRLILVKLLRVMVENDGKVSGSAQIEAAVRAALVPKLASPAEASSLMTPFNFASPAGLDLQLTGSGSREAPLATYYLRNSSLDKLQEFLMRGDRRGAYHYALDEKLWGHALLISSSVDKEAWKEVATEFIKSELSPLSRPSAGGASELPVSNGRESLRVAYSMFAGLGATSVQELLPPKVFTRSGVDTLSTPASVAAPLSPNFTNKTTAVGTIPAESLAKWADTAATIIANPTTGDTAALSTLGDYLLSNKWTEAAHVCYLLSSQQSLFGGLGVQSARMVLLGAETPGASRTWHKDFDAVLFSEILEFSSSLTPTVKGQEAFSGIPHLQAYRLLRASHLAEMGHVQLATRYCDAIRGTLRLGGGKGSAFYTTTFQEQLRELSDRLIAAPHADKTASWITRSLTKPSMDSFGDWIGGRFAKFIEGDEPQPDASTDEATPVDKPVVGPFSHYSNISSTNSSTAPSPSSSVANLANGHANPRRSGSAMGTRPPLHNPYTPIDRAASAMDHLRPGQRPASPANQRPAVTSFYPEYGSAPSSIQSTPENSSATLTVDGDSGGWWGSSSYDSTSATPTATTFYSVDSAAGGSGGEDGNFVSLMAPYSPGPVSTPVTARPSNTQRGRAPVDDDDEDLGFGNSKPKAKPSTDDEGDDEKAAEPKKEEKAAAPAAAAEPAAASSGGGWLSWWRKKDTTDSPKATRANLGEETSFVYDKELKRWVNKKVGAPEAAAATPPPPPPRAQTASPSRALGGPGANTPPPPRPASTINVSTSPPTNKTVPRVRSNLVPSEEDGGPPRSMTASPVSLRNATATPPPPRGSTATPPPPRSVTNTPPPGAGPPRPRSTMGKKSVRSRYVDVFQQPDQ